MLRPLALFAATLVACGPIVSSDETADGTGETTTAGTSTTSTTTAADDTGTAPDLPAPAQCGDGIVSPGQVCLVEEIVLPFAGLAFDGAAGDVDGDGIDELVVTDGAGGDAFVVVRLATDPIVSEPHQLVNASLPVAVGDLDADGRDDVVAAIYSEPALMVARGPDLVQTNVALPIESPQLVGFVDGDAGPALLLASGGGVLSLLIPSGDGFDVVDTAMLGMTDWGANDLREIQALPGAPAYAAASIEVMTCDFSQSFLLRTDVALGSGETVSQTFDLGIDEPRSIAVGDLEGDGVPDIVIANDVGIDRWTAPEGTPTLASTFELAEVADLAFGDFDLDELDDVVAGRPDAGDFWVGSAWATSPAAELYHTGEAFPHHLAVGDFDGDGLDDVAAIDYSGVISIWFARP
jgi:hypothetical protein